MTIEGLPDLPNRSAPDFDRANSDNFSGRVRDARVWHLLVMEDAPSVDLHAGDRIYGQFTPQEFNEDLSATVPEVGGFSRSNPIVQWVGGSVETLSFTARLFSEHRDDTTAQDKYEQLKLLRQALPPRNRPPITNFFWGNAFPGGVPCFVQSLGGVKYDEIRPDGSIRGVTLSITLKKFYPYRVIRNVQSPVEQTPQHVVRDGETYEMIAARHYGDPLIGVVLRRMNPRFPMVAWAPSGLVDLASNDMIKLYDRADVTRVRIKPTSHLFDEDSQVSSDIRRYYFEVRGKKTSILPKR